MTGKQAATYRALLTAAVLAAAVLPVAPAAAQFYRWTDERGELNITEGLQSVPAQFRSRATIVGQPEPRTAPAAAPSAPATGAPARVAPPRGSEAVEGVLARVPFVPGAPIVVTARINGGRSVRLLLDTGASHTTISPRVLSAVGVDMRASGRVSVQGVTGRAEATTVMVQSLEVGEARVGPIEVVAHDPSMLQGEGLLGRDFLDQFQVNIDTAARVVIIGKK